MPYRPIYVAAYETLDGDVEFIWDRDRQATLEAHRDDAELVRLGHFRHARFTLLDVDVPGIQVRDWLLAHPDLWRPR